MSFQINEGEEDPWLILTAIREILKPKTMKDYQPLLELTCTLCGKTQHFHGDFEMNIINGQMTMAKYECSCGQYI